MKNQENNNEISCENPIEFFKDIFQVQHSFDINDEVQIYEITAQSVIQYEKYIDSEDEELILLNISYPNKEDITKTKEKEVIGKILKKYYINNAIVVSKNDIQTLVTYYKYIFVLDKNNQIKQSLKSYQCESDLFKEIKNEIHNNQLINNIYSIFKDKCKNTKSIQDTVTSQKDKQIETQITSNDEINLSTISSLYTYFKKILKEKTNINLRRINKKKYILEKNGEIGTVEKNEDYIELSLLKPLPRININKYNLDVGNTKKSLDIYIENREELEQTIDIIKKIEDRNNS